MDVRPTLPGGDHPKVLFGNPYCLGGHLWRGVRISIFLPFSLVGLHETHRSPQPCIAHGVAGILDSCRALLKVLPSCIGHRPLKAFVNSFCQLVLIAEIGTPLCLYTFCACVWNNGFGLISYAWHIVLLALQVKCCLCVIGTHWTCSSRLFLKTKAFFTHVYRSTPLANLLPLRQKLWRWHKADVAPTYCQHFRKLSRSFPLCKAFLSMISEVI